MKKKIWYIGSITMAVLLFFSLTLISCKTPAEETAPAEEAAPAEEEEMEEEVAEEAPAEKSEIAFFVRSSKFETFQAMMQGAEKSAEENNVNLTIFAAELDPEMQLSQIDTAIEKGIDGAIINPQDSAGIVPGIEKLNQAGIPVMAIDVEPVGGDLLLYIAFSNIQAGEAAAQSLIEILEKQHGEVPEGVILNISGDPAHSAAHLRTEGMDNVINPDTYPQLEVVNVTAHWDSDEAFTVVSDLLERHGDKVLGLETGSDVMIAGITRAIEVAGYFKPVGDPDHIVVSAIDGSPLAIASLAEGVIDAISLQPMDTYGYLSVRYMAWYLEGKEIPKIGDTVVEEGDNVWSPAVVVEHEAGYPNMMVNSGRIGIDIPPDSPLLWANFFERE